LDARITLIVGRVPAPMTAEQRSIAAEPPTRIAANTTHQQAYPRGPSCNASAGSRIVKTGRDSPCSGMPWILTPAARLNCTVTSERRQQMSWAP
jgi:hypothetical protein